MTFIRRVLYEISFRVGKGNVRTRAEQLRIVLKTYPLLVFSQVLLQLVFVLLLWGKADHLQLIFWISCSYTFHAWEIFKWRRDREKIESIADCRQWSRHFTMLALVVGGLWGSAFMFFFPADFNQQVLLICLMLALAAGAVTMISVHPPSMYSYLLAIMCPLTFRVMVEDDAAHMAIAYMLLLFLIVIVIAGRVLQKLIFVSLHQGFQNLALVEQLTEQKMLVEEAKLEIESANTLLRNEGKLLENLVQKRTAELVTKSKEVVDIQDVLMLAMCSLSEARDNETGNHIKRTQNYVRELAIHLQGHSSFRDFLSDEIIEILYKVAPLHDIGKVGIPDAVLLKPGKLTPEEFEIMKTHTTLGGKAIDFSKESYQLHDNKFLLLAHQIATGHHEKWDGTGYPKGLIKQEIPVAARLMALADVYDALISRRIYKDKFTHEHAVELITEWRSSHFDPDIVDAFLEIQQKFQEISNRYID
jgi:response regulator RpfG family c-di-GMP phosphodiesterase